MNDKPYADVDKALATFGAAPIKYRSFGSPVLRPAARLPLAPPAPLPDEPEYDPLKTSLAPPPAPVAPPAAAPPPPPPPARPDHRPAMRSAPVVAQPPPPANETRHAELSESASKLFPLLGAALPEAADVMVTADAPPRGRDFAGPTGGTAAPQPLFQVPPMPMPATPALPPEIPAIVAPPPVLQAPQVHSVAPSPPPAAAWPRARPEPRVPEQHMPPAAAPAPATESPPPFTSLAAHLARTGAASGDGERPGPAGIIAAPRAQASGGPRGDHRSVAEMFRLLCAGRGERADHNSAFARARDGDSALFRRL